MRATVRPAAFDPQAHITSVAADLTALGGGAAVPLVDQGGGLFALANAIVPVDETTGARQITVMVEQQTSAGPRWTKMDHAIAVLPGADVLVLDEGLGAGWQAAGNSKVDRLDLAQGDTARVGQTACAVQARSSWSLTFTPDSPVPPYGYVLRFWYRRGTVTSTGTASLRLSTSPGVQISLATEGLLDAASEEWQQVEIPLGRLVPSGKPVQSVTFTGAFAGTCYLDDIRLVALQPSDSLITAVREERAEALPQGFALDQNRPNPFNSATVIGFALPEAGNVDLAVYNLAGQRVATPAQGQRAAGTYSLHWDGRDAAGQSLASGVYLYRLRVGDQQQEARKLLLVR